MRPTSLDKAGIKPPLPALSPRFRMWLYQSIRLLAPVYRRGVLKIRSYHVEGGEHLIEQIRSFQSGQSRFAVVFRHPNAMDPQCLYYLFTNRARKLARSNGTPLVDVPHVAFLYGRGVPLWAGRLVGWLLPRVGALPVYQGWGDHGGLRAVRDTFAHGRFPIALAPEGQVTYHNYRVDRLEAGAARLSLWCYDDLQKNGGGEVLLLPVAPIYSYAHKPWDTLREIIARTRATMSQNGTIAFADWTGGVDAVIETARELLSVLEPHYARFYTCSVPAAAAEADESSCPTACESSPGAPERDGRRAEAKELSERFARLGRAIMRLVERGYCLDGDEPDGDHLVSRIFTSRRTGWHRRFRADIDSIEGLSPVASAIGNRTAVEAYLLSRHLELVDILTYFDLTYLFERESVDRLIEVALNLYDVASRAQGNTIAGRITVPTSVIMRIGPAIAVSSFAESSRMSRRAAIGAVTDKVEEALRSLSREL